MIKQKTKRDVLKYLQENIVAVIATVGTNKKPEAATIHYFMDDDFNFYFVTRKHTRKFKNLQENNDVAIVVGTQVAPFTAQMEGKAFLLSKEKEIMDFIKKLKTKALKDLYLGYLPISPFPAIAGVDYALFKVKINWLRWMSFDEKSKKEIYTQII